MFTVIIPLHNKQDYIEETLSSVLLQKEFIEELIIVDDCSTDNSVIRAKSQLEPSGVKYRILRRNQAGPGGYAARNMGMKEAKSDWIALVDADDQWLPEHLSTIRSMIVRNPNVHIASTQLNERYNSFENERVINLSDYLHFWSRNELLISSSTVAFRKEVVESVGFFNEKSEGRGCDKDYWLRLMQKYDLVFTPKVTCLYNQLDPNMVTKRTKVIKEPGCMATLRNLKTNMVGNDLISVKVIMKKEWLKAILLDRWNVALALKALRDIYLR